MPEIPSLADKLQFKQLKSISKQHLYDNIFLANLISGKVKAKGVKDLPTSKSPSPKSIEEEDDELPSAPSTSFSFTQQDFLKKEAELNQRIATRKPDSLE